MLVIRLLVTLGHIFTAVAPEKFSTKDPGFFPIVCVKEMNFENGGQKDAPFLHSVPLLVLCLYYVYAVSLLYTSLPLP